MNVDRKSAQSTTLPARRNRRQPVESAFSTGTRFSKDGHWWEVEQAISSRTEKYYKCRPVCFVETRFYTQLEIQYALDLETERFSPRLSATPGKSGKPNNVIPLVREPIAHTRGSGRITASSKKNEAQTSNKVETAKLLAVGTRKSVEETITSLHALGYAKATDWSPIQSRPKTGEVLSILIQKAVHSS